MKNAHIHIPAIVLALLVVASQDAVFAYGQQNNNNNDGNGWSSNPSPTPASTAAPTPAPISAGTAAEESSPDDRYITVELELATPQYSNRGYLSTGYTINGLVHFNARRSAFRGYYEGTQRNPTTEPSPAATAAPTSQPVTDPSRLTQQPPPPPLATPVPSPGTHYWDKSDTARKYAKKGNKRRHHGGENGHQD